MFGGEARPGLATWMAGTPLPISPERAVPIVSPHTLRPRMTAEQRWLRSQYAVAVQHAGPDSPRAQRARAAFMAARAQALAEAAEAALAVARAELTAVGAA